MAVRELVDQPLKELGEIYESSLKSFLLCGLEFYLSMSLVLSFFQCPDTSVQDEQELQTLYTMSWMPLLLGVVVVYGCKVSRALFPAPENLDRNILRGKVITWIYAFCFLIWDDDMVVKTGPSLGVSILFCVCDIGRFLMDMHGLLDVELDDDGNSFVVPHPPQQQHADSYTVSVISTTGLETAQKLSEDRQQSASRPVERSQQQRTPAPLYGGVNKPGSRRRLLEQERKAQRTDNLSVEKSPSAIDSEYVAILESNSARARDKEATELLAKKSFTYEF
ncbi:hypothetical protein BBJ28_00007483 [Nothophytophthora sp. Chile5]|nr:hypothetical protein BBJ28_00007483 [Nothophytophthora sp. Chile5]